MPKVRSVGLLGCSSELSWPPAGRTQTGDNRLTLEGQLCWSCGAAGVWGGGCRLHPASSHRHIYTVCFENSLSSFTWGHSWKTDRWKAHQQVALLVTAGDAGSLWWEGLGLQGWGGSPVMTGVGWAGGGGVWQVLLQMLGVFSAGITSRTMVKPLAEPAGWECSFSSAPEGRRGWESHELNQTRSRRLFWCWHESHWPADSRGMSRPFTLKLWDPEHWKHGNIKTPPVLVSKWLN